MKSYFKLFSMFFTILLLISSCDNQNTENTNVSQKNNNKIKSNIKKRDKKAPKKNNINSNTSTMLSKHVVNKKNTPKYTGDLDIIKKKGVLRVLAVKNLEERSIPNKKSLIDEEIKYLKEFARENKLKFKFVYKKNFKNLIPALKNGEGDVIAANLTVTENRKENIDFTNALTSINEVIIGKQYDKINSPEDLKNRKIYVKKSTAYFKSAKKIFKDIEGLKIIEAPENLTEDMILDKVSEGKFDLTIVDDNKFEEFLLYRNDLKSFIPVKKHLSISWGIRKNSLELKKELNKFISIKHIDLRVERIYTDDFEKIKKRGYIRILTRNNSMNYFIYKGNIFGFEYELSKFFAKKYKLRVEFVIPPSRDKLVTWLLEGKGDIIAASITKNSLNSNKISYTQKYDTITENIVSSPDSKIEKLEDLKDKTFYIRKSSSYNKTLLKYKDKYKYNIKYVSEDEETEEIIEKVAIKSYKLTLADSSILDREISMGTKIKKLFTFDDSQKEYSWIVRKTNPILLKEIDKFFKLNYKGLIFNIIYNKYFKNIKRISKLNKFRTNNTGKISKYDELFKKYSKKYDFNWLIIASQSYMESRFNPNAKSWVGALGLMQVMPKTGKMLGFTDLITPKYGVHAGVKYMKWLEKRFSPDIPAKDKMWFALASYNAGYGHILDAQRLAKIMGLNPNKWFNNVETAMKNLSNKKYRKLLKYGYCKCTEPIAYVSNIKTRYEAYENVINKNK